MQGTTAFSLKGTLPAGPRRNDAERRAVGAESADATRWDGGQADDLLDMISPGGDLPPGFGSSGDAPQPEDRNDESAPDEAGDVAPELLTPSAMILADLEHQGAADRKRLRWTIVAATIFHAVLLLVTMPTWDYEPKRVGQKSKIFVMEQVRFQKPPQQIQQRQEIPDPKKKRIPIPDPTPDDPEPLRVEDLEVPDLPPTNTDEFFFGIPEGPDPGFFAKNAGFTGQAVQVGDGILKPEGILQPQPRYTESARQARIQGVVILSCVIDEEGNVRNLKAVKGLSMGLTESALETVATWKYKPAHTPDGQPVAVYYHITVGFWLQ
ncbi:MAG: TonB family protein [Thermoanaerobaculia bacterium]|nr:TonB family protein [Thermoanaerobaculia bacterium]